MRRNLATTPAFVIALALSGCGADKPSQFPSQSQLSDIAARPVPRDVLPKESGRVAAWKLGAPPAAAIATAPHQGDAPWDGPVLAFAAQRGGSFVASESLHCVATETARVVAEQEVGPPAALRRFIATRCGAPLADYAYASEGLRVPAETPDERVVPSLVAKLPAMLTSLDKGGRGPRLGGAGFARGARGAVLVVASQERAASLEPTPVVPVDGKIVLRGQAAEPIDKLRAVVNRGAFGYAPCAVRADVRLPAFEVTCEVDPRDASAWVEVAGFLPGRVLGRPVVEALVFPSGQPSDTFTPPAATDATPITAANLVVALNARRAEAGLGPVALDGAESEIVEQLTPHYFAAASGLVEETVADQIVLGVQAGWAVRGLVELGHSASAIASSAGGAAGVIDAELEHPIERSALFDPTVARVAVGIVRDAASQRVGVLMGAYALVDDRRLPEQARALVARIAQLRAARGLPPPEIVAEIAPIADLAVHGYERGSETDADALDAFMRGSSVQLRAPVRGFCLHAISMDTLAVPEQLLTAPSLRLGFGIAHRKEGGDPWATLTVFLVQPGAT